MRQLFSILLLLNFFEILFQAKSRVIVAKPSEVSNIVENFSNELSDEACDILDDCKKEYCQKNDTVRSYFLDKLTTEDK